MCVQRVSLCVFYDFLMKMHWDQRVKAVAVAVGQSSSQAPWLFNPQNKQINKLWPAETPTW